MRRPALERSTVVVAAIGIGLLALAVREGNITGNDLLFLAVLLPSIILHEVSHGAAALVFGDDTAKRAGRLTLNPLRHVDPFGTVILPAVLILIGANAFGYAKPVPVNPRQMREPRNHGLLTSLAGPATNIVIAVGAAMAFRALQPVGAVRNVLLALGLANVVLAAFNLIPIPPLDGSAVVERLLPSSWWPGYLRLRQYSMLILLGVVLFVPGALSRVFQPAVELWARLLT